MGGVKQFYSGKNVLITGATGFVGICLLEKILRTIPDHGDVYLLMRPKFGKEISQRLEELKKNLIFSTLLKEQPSAEFFEKVKLIAGDIGQENLGLSDTDRNILIQNVNVIFHSAATLDFGDTFQSNININLLGTRRITELAKQCSNLKALVYVSSAYANAFLLNPEEILYPLTKDPEELIDMVSKLSPEELERKSPEILGDHPNNYTITKHMAEHEIKKCESLFPCAIVRPSMIVGSWKEPTIGWTVSKNGPQGFLMGASKGIIRRLPLAKKLIYDYIPIDIVVNNLLVAGCHVATMNAKQLEIYHCTSSTRNPFRWNAIEHSINCYLHTYPLMSTVWYPNLKLLESITHYKISAFFVHILPAIPLDILAFLTGGRPILLKLHRNVYRSLNRLYKFMYTEWKFPAKNTDALQKFLKEDEQDIYNLDISNLIWPVYFNDLTLGARIYLSKDPEKTLKAARQKDSILFVAHVILKIGVVILIWYLLSRLLGIGMERSWPFLIPAGLAYLAIV